VELDRAVTFAPSGDVVVRRLASLRKGGVVAINAIHLDRMPQFDYDRLLWGERQIRSVANMTRARCRDLFPLDQANQALAGSEARRDRRRGGYRAMKRRSRRCSHSARIGREHARDAGRPVGKQVHVLPFALDGAGHAAGIQAHRHQEDFLQRDAARAIERVADFGLKAAAPVHRPRGKARHAEIRCLDGGFQGARPVLARQQFLAIHPGAESGAFERQIERGCELRSSMP
jgi:hypothetical protein